MCTILYCRSGSWRRHSAVSGTEGTTNGNYNVCVPFPRAPGFIMNNSSFSEYFRLTEADRTRIGDVSWERRPTLRPSPSPHIASINDVAVNQVFTRKSGAPVTSPRILIDSRHSGIKYSLPSTDMHFPCFCRSHLCLGNFDKELASEGLLQGKEIVADRNIELSIVKVSMKS